MLTHSAELGNGGQLMSRRTMLIRSSAGLLTVIGAGALVACGGDDGAGSPGATASGDTGGSGASSEPSEITQLLSTPGPSFANALTAIAHEMGFYEEANVVSSEEFPGNSIRALQTMVGGTGTVASSDSFAVLVAAGEGLELRSIYGIARGYIFGIAVSADSPIQEWGLEVVRGSRIGITDFAGGEVPVLRGALARLGISEGGDDGVDLVPIGGGGAETADAIESGSVDLVAASILDFEIFKAAGVDLRVITPDFIRAFPGPGFTTTPELLDANLGGIEGLLRATAMATVFLRANPMAAAEIAIAAAPASAEGLEIEFVATFLENLFSVGNEFAFDESDPDYRRLGAQSPANFDDYQQFLLETGIEDDDGTTLSNEVDVEPIVDNSMIDAANDFDYAEIQALAEGS